MEMKRKCAVTGLIFEKMEALYAKLNEKVEANSSSYFTTSNFLQYIYTYIYTLYICLFIFIFICIFVFCKYVYIYTYLLTYIQGSCIKKNLCDCFRFLWLRTLIAIIRRCAEQCVLKLYRTSWNQIILIIAAIVVKLLYKNEYMTLLSISYHQGTQIIV